MNSYVYPICFVAFLTALQVQSQPVLDLSVLPIVGNKMDYFGTNLTQVVDPGAPGPNQVWSLPYVPSPIPNLQQTCIVPAGTPFAAQFPGAQSCIKTLITSEPTRFEYFTQTDTSSRMLGQAFLGNIVYKNDPPWEQLYPMNYGAIQNGQFKGSLKVGSQTTYYRTQFQRHYDGYGMLAFDWTPTYQNAMRVKTTLTRVDSLPGTNGAHKRTIVNETFYNWFVAGIPGYVAHVSEVNSTQMNIAANGDTTQLQQFPTQSSMEWQIRVNVASAEPSVIEAYNLFAISGNPALDYLHIWPKEPTGKLTRFSILDPSGKTLYSDRLQLLESIQIPVSHYPPGIYLLVLEAEDGRRSAQKWIKL